jgi:ferredoxin--NADP+ reductase
MAAHIPASGHRFPAMLDGQQLLRPCPTAADTLRSHKKTCGSFLMRGLAMTSAADALTFPEVVMNRYTPRKPAVATVARNDLCTASKKTAGFARHLVFDLAGTDLVASFAPGQCLGVIPPGVDHRGKPHKPRLYSISSPSRGEEGQGRFIGTPVKRLIDEHWTDHTLVLGVCSNYLCDLQPGDEVQLTGPVGKRFLLPQQPAEHAYIFFATGTGIAPFRAMALDLLERGTTRPIVVIAGSPYDTDLIYHQQLKQLDDEYKNFHYLTAVSRQWQNDVHEKLYVHDRLRTHEALLKPILEEPGTLVYICGLTGMELGIYRQLGQMLSPESLASYLVATDEAPDNPGEWTRHMIGRSIQRTDRLLTEVYD